MVDFKFHDIQSAMKEAIKIMNNADIITVHCSALFDPFEFEMEEYANKLAGVTILTSMKEEDFRLVYSHRKIIDQVLMYESFASYHNYGYLVCSPQELNFLETDITVICPGIRPKWYQEKDEQSRTMTPKDAIIEGADLLVIGRPILNANDIVEAINKTNNEIEEALKCIIL